MHLFVTSQYNFHTIQLVPYFWCTHIHTSSLNFFLLIQSTIIRNSEVRVVVCFDRIKQLYDHSHFILLVHSHSYYINYIHCFVDSIYHSQEKRYKSTFLFQLNTVFVGFQLFHIFDALTFILHHSHFLFWWFNWSLLWKARWEPFSIEYNFCLIQLIPYLWCTHTHTTLLTFIAL